jgi:hypothetical protein
MSMNGLRIGGQFKSRRPPTWALNLFAVCVFTPLALAFVAGGWCLIACSHTRPHLCTPNQEK